MVSATRLAMSDRREPRVEITRPGRRTWADCLSPLFGHYVFVDYATQGYIVLVGVIILFGHSPRVPFWPLQYRWRHLQHEHSLESSHEDRRERFPSDLELLRSPSQ